MNQANSLFDEVLEEIAFRVVAKMSMQAAQRRGDAGPRLLDVRAASKYLSISEWAVRGQIKAGHLPVVRRGSRVFIDRQSLDCKIDECGEASIQ